MVMWRPATTLTAGLPDKAAAGVADLITGRKNADHSSARSSTGSGPRPNGTDGLPAATQQYRIALRR
ncbi:hypothetical protein ACIBSV_06855 [Embleya sp. NPDC050154]|uniref:hypothetical protein n=1 Tax=Embleya sp. NPDC050154 TaxID=3363988 RepID=UPI003797D82D